MSINWWMDKDIVVYIHNGILRGHEKEWNMVFCSNVDGTGECYAKWNKSYRERQIPYVFTLMWILRNLTEDHGRGGRKKKVREGGSQNKRLLKTENRGAWVVQLAEHSDFGSGHDLTVCEFQPRVRLCADSLEPRACFRFCVSLSNFLFPSPPPWSSVKFLRTHIGVKTYGICLSLYDLFHLA